MLGIQIRGRRMVGADKTMELLRPPMPVYVFKKWANLGPLSIYFWSFQANIITIFTTNQCEKMSCPSSIRRQDSNPRLLERESPPITTRPGLPPVYVNYKQNGLKWSLQRWRKTWWKKSNFLGVSFVYLQPCQTVIGTLFANNGYLHVKNYPALPTQGGIWTHNLSI